MLRVLTINLVVGLLLLTGCALSPQVVSLNPELDMNNFNAVGAGKRVALQVIDNRPGRLVGSRGGIYADTSSITTTADIASPVRTEFAAALNKLGFNVVTAGDTADADLRLLVDALEYKTAGGSVIRSIETAATLRTIGKVGKREFTGRYRATKSKDVVKTPGPEENELLINAVISRVLARALEDQALLEFLRDG